MVSIRLFGLALGLVSQVNSFNSPLYTSHEITTRDSLTCALENTSYCSNDLPGNFCCSDTSTCNLVANKTTVVCCPNGTSCAAISPIDCNIQLQNITTKNNTVIMTTDLSGTLPSCGGSKCCPFGYTCANNDICIQNTDQAPGTSSSTATSSPTTTVSLPVASSTTSTGTASIIPVACPMQDCPKYPVPAILIGLFPGLLAGALIAIASICLLGARRARKEAQSPSSPFGRVAASISDPIYNGAHNSIIARSYSLRKSPKVDVTTNTLEPMPRGAAQRVKSLFTAGRRSQQAVQLTDSPGYIRSQCIAAKKAQYPSPSLSRPSAEMSEVPITPTRLELQREPSSESINIFADPNVEHTPPPKLDVTGTSGGLGAWDERRGTTFSDLMERADLGGVARGEGFVETPRQRAERERIATGTMPVGRPKFVEGRF